MRRRDCIRGKYSEAQFGGNTPVGNPALLLAIYNGPAGEGDQFAPGFDPDNYRTVFASFPTANVFFAEDLSSPTSQEFTLQAGTELFAGRGFAQAVYIQRDFDNFVEDFITTETGDTEITEGGRSFGYSTIRCSATAMSRFGDTKPCSSRRDIR